MSVSRYGRKKRLMSEINVVPYIDVMLVLLIIFMVTTPLLSTGVDVNLPKAAAEPMENQDEEPFVVTVDKEGNYYINDDEDEIATDREIEIKARAVLQRNPSLPFLVRGDGRRTMLLWFGPWFYCNGPESSRWGLLPTLRNHKQG